MTRFFDHFTTTVCDVCGDEVFDFRLTEHSMWHYAVEEEVVEDAGQ